MIELRDVERSYQTGPTRSYVLRRIDLTIREGEFVTIMGPSGAGKSTLLAILGMLDHTWTGEFHFLGEPVHTLAPRKRVELNKRYIGFVFQKYHLIDDLTVYENLEIPLSYRDVKPKERAGDRRGDPGPVPDGGEEGPVSEPALRRSAAARRRGAGRDRRSQAAAGRRADREPAQRPG